MRFVKKGRVVKNFIIGIFILLSIAYLAFFIQRFSNEEFNKQLIGNLLITNLGILPNYINGLKNSTPYSLEIKLPEKSLNQFDNIIDSLYSYRVKFLRFFYYLGKEISFTQIIMPNIKYEKAEIFFHKKKHRVSMKLTGGQLDHFNTKKVQ